MSIKLFVMDVDGTLTDRHIYIMTTETTEQWPIFV